MINSHAELISIVALDAGGEKSVCADIRHREQAQQVHRERALGERIGGIGSWHLVERVGLAEKNIEQLMCRVGTKSGNWINAFCAHRGKIALSLGQRRYCADKAVSLATAKTFIEPEKKGLVVAHRSADAPAKLVLLQRLNYCI